MEILGAIGGVGVDGKLDAGEILANALDLQEIFAGLDFELDALVAGGEFFFDGVRKFVGRIFYADGNAAGDFLLRAADEFPQRNIFEFGFRVPDGIFDGGLGHIVPADLGKARPDFGSGGELLAFQHGPEVGEEDVPGGFGVFGRVEGIFSGGAFAPAGGAVDGGFDEEDAALGDAIHAGLEGSDEREMNFAESEGVQAHG